MDGIGKKRAIDSRKVENSLNKKLNAEMNLQNDPTNMILNKELTMAKDSLRRLQAKKIQGLRVTAKMNLPKKEDKGSIFFLRFIKK